MASYRPALRQSQVLARTLRSNHPTSISCRRYASSNNQGGRRGGVGKILGLLTVAVASGAAVWIYPQLTAEPPALPQAEIKFEKPRREPKSKEDNRDLISSQHLQVKQSWENPGVYAWGSNAGRVAAPDSSEPVIKTPRRIAYFDGQLIRDIKLDQEFGAAVTEKGDLVQWGTGFNQNSPKPVLTLKGKDLAKIEISHDRIIALGRNGTVYSIPVSSNDQAAGNKSQESSWTSFWTSTSPVSYRQLTPQNLSWGEKVTDVRSGVEHCLLLTSSGRVFSAASSGEDFPSRGQLGIPGLTFATRPKGAFDQPHEVTSLKGFKIASIAAGDFHSLALDEEGRVFAFGDNTSGQLGFPVEPDLRYLDTPTPLPFSKLYAGSNQKPRVTSITAGGSNSFFTVDATRIAEQTDDKTSLAPARDLGRVTADTWAAGSGIFGSLGTGKWTHVSPGPTKIKPLSALFEWDEKAHKTIPIRLARLSVGSTHAAAVMDNVTNVDAQRQASHNDTNWGADVVWWGGNEHYQLGTGKRNNINAPVYIGPLDGGEGDARKGRRGEQHRFQITPRTTARLGEGGSGRKVSVEQRVECGRNVTAVYSGT